MTFTDDDPGSFDIDLWVDLMRRTQSNALCISAGGYMAFYPTKIPFHHRSAHLGDTDPFGELIAHAKRLGMVVMARVDPHAIHADAAAAHPEWLARDEHGDPVEHSSMLGVYWTDPFSTYLSEHITAIAQEITAEYDVDALFANRWETVRGVSYSEPVAARFRTETGFELPRFDNLDDPAWPAYNTWRAKAFSELVGIWDDAVQAVKPHVRFLPNRGPQITRDLVREKIEDRYPMFVIDKQGRWGAEPVWTSGRIGKRTAGLWPGKPMALLSSVGTEDHVLRWKDSVTDPHELKTYLVDGFIHGGRPWFCKFKAELFDNRWIEPVVEAFELHARCETVLEGLEPTAEVAVLDAGAPDGPTPWHKATGHTGDHEDGIYQALLEARIPFTYVSDQILSAEALEGIRVLVLGSTRELGDEQLGVIEEFVTAGGSVVACFDATLNSAPGQPQLGLGNTLGVEVVSDERGPVKNNYITFSPEHPLATGFEGAQRIVGGTKTLEVKAGPAADVAFRFIPDYPDLPMEEVYPRRYDGAPAVVTSQHPSGGRAVYIGFNIAEIYWQALQSDHGRLLANSVRWAMGEDPALVEVDGPGLVDIAVRHRGDQSAVSLVNLHTPAAMRGQRHEIIPLPPQQLRLRVPSGATGAQAHLLVAGITAEVTMEGQLATVEIPQLDLLETVHITWNTADSST
ncbi:alpha-amylase family protein [Nesterenkonia ebinurensis]|uniref:alpha-amylase family protein n=1 Tax=Nesterenkonia ebinurensis TaxID=2608252 RepID=UPI001CC6D813|nr:alpha-amylase family protein [Nesterenkonia ebinurensis]